MELYDVIYSELQTSTLKLHKKFINNEKIWSQECLLAQSDLSIALSL